MGKTFVTIFIFILLPVTVFAVISNHKTQQSITAQKFNPIKESAINDPYLQHLRVALDGYLAGTNNGIKLPEFVVKSGKTNENQILGLSSFDKTYYQSEFTVIKIEDGPSYGKILTIFFEKKPDKIFDCWIYKDENGYYDLRGFWEYQPSANNK